MLQVRDMRYAYGENTALAGVSFDLPRGQIAGLLGENGAGKTTLIRCMLRLLKGTGSVTLDGQPIGPAQREKVAFISGEGHCIANLTPRETGGFFQTFYPAFDGERYAKLIDFFELDERPVREMSKGERAKAELAVGFSRGADYILMDEPFGGKDVFTRRDFLKIMAGTLGENETVLLCTHLVDEVENFLDRALILHKGELVADVDMDELRAQGTLLSLLREKTGYDESRVAAMFA